MSTSTLKTLHDDFAPLQQLTTVSIEFAHDETLRITLASVQPGSQFTQAMGKSTRMAEGATSAFESLYPQLKEQDSAPTVRTAIRGLLLGEDWCISCDGKSVEIRKQDKTARAPQTVAANSGPGIFKKATLDSGWLTLEGRSDDPGLKSRATEVVMQALEK